MFTKAELIDVQEAIKTELEYSARKEARMAALVKKENSLRRRINRSALIAVHLTDFFPDGGVIKTRGNVGIEVDGKKIYYPRETIHFALNGPVGSHMYGSWDGKKYVILVPALTIWDRITNLRPEDTFILGDLKLPKEAEILGTPNNIQKKNSGRAKLVPLLEGESAFNGARRRIREKGYVEAKIGMYDWSFQSEAEALQEIAPVLHYREFGEMVAKEGKSASQHLHGLFGKIESFYDGVLALILGKMVLTVSEIDREIERCNHYKNKVKEIIERNRFKVIHSADEDQALQRMFHTFERLPYQLELVKIKTSKIKKVEELTEEEREWLLSDYHLLEKMRKKVDRRKFRSAKRVLKRLSRRERKTYKVYQELRKEIETIKSRTSMTIDLSSIEEALEIQEAKLARGLSRASNELISLIEKEDIESLDKYVIEIEKSIASIEASLGKLIQMVHHKQEDFQQAA